MTCNELSRANVVSVSEILAFDTFSDDVGVSVWILNVDVWSFVVHLVDDDNDVVKWCVENEMYGNLSESKPLDIFEFTAPMYVDVVGVSCDGQLISPLFEFTFEYVRYERLLPSGKERQRIKKKNWNEWISKRENIAWKSDESIKL